MAKLNPPPSALIGPVLSDRLAGLAGQPAKMGHLLLDCGFAARACAAFEAANLVTPDKPWGDVGLARLAKQRGDLPVAEEIWRRLAARFPRDAAPWQAALAGTEAETPDPRTLAARLTADCWDMPALLGLLRAASRARDVDTLRGLLMAPAYADVELPSLFQHKLALQRLAREADPARSAFFKISKHADETNIFEALFEAAPLLFDQVHLVQARSKLAIRLDTMPESANSERLRSRLALSLGDVGRHSKLAPQVGSSTKIFGTGLSRTGTSSLAAALQVLGYQTLHWTNPDTNELIQAADADRFNALTDTPCSAMFEFLADRFPTARFIHTVRELGSWLDSFTNHFQQHHDLASFDDLRAALKAGADFPWGQSYRNIMMKLYGVHPSPAAAYANQDARVRQFFASQPHRLLILDVTRGEGWDRLCQFLNLPQPQLPFPHRNSRFSRRVS